MELGPFEIKIKTFYHLSDCHEVDRMSRQCSRNDRRSSGVRHQHNRIHYRTCFLRDITYKVLQRSNLSGTISPLMTVLKWEESNTRFSNIRIQHTGTILENAFHADISNQKR